MSRQPHPLAILAQIVSTPSGEDGIPRDLENDLRVVGCMMIQEAGIMLDLVPWLLLKSYFIDSTLSLLFVPSEFSSKHQDISISALYLSTKLNETPIRLRDLINTYIFLTARIQHLLSFPADQPLLRHPTLSSSGVPGSGKGKEKEREPIWNDFIWEVPNFHDEVFWDWKDIITAGEMQILKRLGFNMQVDLPYNHAINYLKVLDLVFEDDVAQITWSILNDLLLTPVYAIHPPHVIACASILLASRLQRIALPEKWYILFDVDWDDISGICEWVVSLWNEWGIGPVEGAGDRAWSLMEMKGGGEGEKGDRMRQENRWRRSWILMQGKKAVRKWVEERDRP